MSWSLWGSPSEEAQVAEVVASAPDESADAETWAEWLLSIPKSTIDMVLDAAERGADIPVSVVRSMTETLGDGVEQTVHALGEEAEDLLDAGGDAADKASSGLAKLALGLAVLAAVWLGFA